MGAVPLTPTANDPQSHAEILPPSQEKSDLLGMAVGGSLLVGALLLLSGKRRAGLVVTAAATALTLLDEQDTVRAWWNSLPHYLDEAQLLLNKAQTAIDDLTSKRDKLRTIFGK
jgi:hypothetical protein